MTNQQTITEDTIILFLEYYYDITIADEMLECKIYPESADIECYFSDEPNPDEEDPFDWESGRYTVDFQSEAFLNFLKKH